MVRFSMKIQFISRLYTWPVVLLFNLDIRFSTFVLFNLDSRFLSSTFVLFKGNVR